MCGRRCTNTVTDTNRNRTRKWTEVETKVGTEVGTEVGTRTKGKKQLRYFLTNHSICKHGDRYINDYSHSRILNTESIKTGFLSG